MDYINACNDNIKAGKMKRAKQAFDLAWKNYASGNYSTTEELQLFWLRGNFYPRMKKVAVTERACYYEDAILAMAGL